MDDKEDIAEESPRALDQGPADPLDGPAVELPAEGPVPDLVPGQEDPAPNPEVRKPGLYVLRPQGIRPAPRPARRRLSRLRNDCPPDQRRPSNRPALKPRLR